MLFLEICRRFNSSKIPYMVVGGYALSLHGIVRATVDVDFVVSLKERHLGKAETILQELNLTSRLPITSKEVASFHAEYYRQRNLIAWSFTNLRNPIEQVDLLIFPPLKSLKKQIISVYGTKIPVATPESLLKMKTTSGRPQDKLDIIRLKELLNEKGKR